MTGRIVFLYTDFSIFYVLPVVVGGAVAWFATANTEISDFILKFSLLSMPLALNLFFHVIRLIQDDQKKRRDDEKDRATTEANGQSQWAVRLKLKQDSMTELAYHILYCACSCFFCAVLAGAFTFKAVWPHHLTSLSNSTVWIMQFALSLVLYSVSLHAFIVALQILRKTYNIFSFVLEIENTKPAARQPDTETDRP